MPSNVPYLCRSDGEVESSAVFTSAHGLRQSSFSSASNFSRLAGSRLQASSGSLYHLVSSWRAASRGPGTLRFNPTFHMSAEPMSDCFSKALGNKTNLPIRLTHTRAVNWAEGSTPHHFGRAESLLVCQAVTGRRSLVYRQFQA